MNTVIFSSFILGCWILVCGADGVNDVTALVHMRGEGVIAGYGDFNSDKATDVFMISQQWTALDLYFWDVTKQTFKPAKQLLDTAPAGFKIVNIALADFNGDGNMDILLSTKAKILKDNDAVTVEIYYGNTASVKKGNFTAQMTDQPTILDVNGDLLPDLFGTNFDKKTRSYWISKLDSKSKEHTFILENQISTTTTLSIPNSNAFIDVTGDLHPDLFLKSMNEQGEIMFETWEQNPGMLNLTLNNKDVIMLDSIKEKIVHIGQMSFADIDGDSRTDLILPVCLNDDCTQSVVYSKGLRDDTPWIMLLNNDNAEWQFPLKDMQNQTPFPVMLRLNDITMDGMVDAVAILQEKKADGKGKLFPAYFVNSRCPGLKHCAGNRTLYFNPIDVPIDNPVLISLMDVNENGVLDFMVTYEKQNKKYYTKVLHNELTFDTAFLKVAVLSGLKSLPMYGSNQIGAIVQISTTNTDGSSMLGENTQLSQSTYFSLQLPYVIFGLGRSPNFVEEIKVGVPKGPQKIDRVRSWTAIIPNAQVIVIPYPKDKPYDWVTKLLVTPGKLLLQTGGVLIGTILLIGGLILILHIKEKKEDEREKRRDAHKFHFDAL